MPQLAKPRKILELRGSRHLRGRKQEPQPEIPTSLGETPEWLSESARPHWLIIGKMLHEAGIYTKADKMALGFMCDTFAKYLAAKAVLEVEGDYQEAQKGGMMAHPALREMRDARDATILMMKQFGMTPSSRAGIIRQDTEAQSNAEKFFHSGTNN